MAQSKAVRTSESPGGLAVILLCFFASGMSGLVYQVIWVRELVLVFGATTFAVSTVLTAFMGGLALGSFYFGRRSEKIKRPLRLYGLLEVGIGIYGLAVPFIFASLPTIYQPFWQRLQISFLALSITRFIFAAVVLAIPTALMGATLPVLASYWARDHRSMGLRVGALYSFNTFGAVFGAAATGLFLIPALGMRNATLAAAAINLSLGFVALGLARRHEADSYPVTAPIDSDAASGSQARPSTEKRRRSKQNDPVSRTGEMLSRGQIRVVLASFALSGFVALSYEVIWTRVLALIIGSSVYAFSVMLTTFLVGLALGAAWATRVVDRIKRRVALFAVLEIGVGLTALGGAYLFTDLPYFFIQVYRWFEGSNLGLLLASRFLLASMVMIVPTLLLGAMLPLVVKIASGSGSQDASGKTVGDAYSANTMGAIVGSFASGFILIPWFGLVGSLKLCVAINFIIAAALFAVSTRRVQLAGRWPFRWTTGPAAIASPGVVVSLALAVTVSFLNPPWNSEIMSSAVYRYAPSMANLSREGFADYLRSGHGGTLFYKEGVTATVAVQEQESARILKVNGKPEASTSGDMPTQVLIGALPLLVREKTDDVLLIGLGSGITLGSVQQFPVKQVTCIELEPAVIEASEYFNNYNNRPLEDPRLQMVANDGRNFIFTTDRKFDVIISEPSNPWFMGVANLFTVEYFKRGADRLTDDGVFSQWLQIYEMAPEDVISLVATFRAAFPYVHIFRGAEGDLMLLGSKQDVRLNAETIGRHLRDDRIKADLKRIKVSSVVDILSRFYLGPSEIAHFTAGAEINSDDNALIEFNAPRRVGIHRETVQENVRKLLSCSASPLSYLASGPALTSGQADLLIEAALSAIARNDLGRAEQFVGYSMALAETARAHSVLGELKLAWGDQRGALETWLTALALDPNHFYTLIDLGKLYLTQKDSVQAALYLDRAVQADPKSARARHLRGLLYQATGDNARAVDQYRHALPDAAYARSFETFYLNFGAALSTLGHYEEARQMLEEYTKLAPSDIEGHFQLGVVYEILAERTLSEHLTRRAIDELKLVLASRRSHAMAHYYLSKAYRRLEEYDLADAEFELYERMSP